METIHTMNKFLNTFITNFEKSRHTHTHTHTHIHTYHEVNRNYGKLKIFVKS
jgi:hypothetical protein